jgi:hypothetical protein
VSQPHTSRWPSICTSSVMAYVTYKGQGMHSLSQDNLGEGSSGSWCWLSRDRDCCAEASLRLARIQHKDQSRRQSTVVHVCSTVVCCLGHVRSSQLRPWIRAPCSRGLKCGCIRHRVLPGAHES